MIMTALNDDADHMCVYVYFMQKEIKTSNSVVVALVCYC